MLCSATRDTQDPTSCKGCSVIAKLHYLRDLGQGVSHKLCSPGQTTCQQRDNQGQGRSHVVPTPIHQLIQQLHLLAGTLQLGNMLQAMEKKRSWSPTSASKSFLREGYVRGWMKWGTEGPSPGWLLQ